MNTNGWGSGGHPLAGGFGGQRPLSRVNENKSGDKTLKSPV